ncbi:hypothetical protein L1887_38680 [Cichorium endivia]|nr:hypothetical protein L1887_38680 [Cichorium endivia]
MIVIDRHVIPKPSVSPFSITISKGGEKSASCNQQCICTILYISPIDSTWLGSLTDLNQKGVLKEPSSPISHHQRRRNQYRSTAVLGEDLRSITFEDALKSCLVVNASLLYRSASRVPFSVPKYAMTLDGEYHLLQKMLRFAPFDPHFLTGKIAASSGHASWISSKKGARRSFQKVLASKGVEVVEFDILNPKDVVDCLFDRGYPSILWECGGTLSTSAISSGVIYANVICCL